MSRPTISQKHAQANEMRWVRWLIFGWLATVFAWLAGGRVSYPKPETQKDKIIRLLSLDNPSKRQQKELDRLLKGSDVVIVD